MSAEVTEDAVLGGKLRLKQPSGGHRVGHDAILLAAACPARAGERVVDLGAGVGAAGLALARRVDGARVVLVEVDAALAALAAENAQLNGLGARVSAVALDVAAPARTFAAAGLAPESVTRILMNPPFNDPARQRASPDRQRRLAHAGSGETLRAWIKTAARLLRPRGTLSVICRADRLAELLQALAPAFGAATVLPGLSWRAAARGASSRAGDKGQSRAARAAPRLYPQRRVGSPHGASGSGAAGRCSAAAE